MTSYFVYKVIMDLESIDHLFINPILSEMYTTVLYLAILNKITSLSLLVGTTVRVLFDFHLLNYNSKRSSAHEKNTCIMIVQKIKK